MTKKISQICIISHTEHYLNEEGEACAWGATVRELNHLLEIAKEVVHIAPFHQGKAPASSMTYASERIKWVTLKPSGGKGIQKLSILQAAVHNLKIIHQHTQTADYIQFRAPTGMGVYVLPYLRWFRNRKYWVKYAGNWMDANMPLGNRFQKFWLKKFISKTTKVTINGNWETKTNFLAFENPCLTVEELEVGEDYFRAKQKRIHPKKYKLAFIGALSEHKGVHFLIQALCEENLALNFESLTLIGDGKLRDSLTEKAKQASIPVIFKGFVDKTEIGNMLQAIDFLILPSKSEGFPKVIAEAMNYAVVPIVTDVSCMKEYINNSNGILIDQASSQAITKALHECMQWKEEKYHQALTYNRSLAYRFTYKYYNQHLLKSILMDAI